MYSLLLTILLIATVSGEETNEPIVSAPAPIHIHFDDEAHASPTRHSRVIVHPLNTLRDEVTKSWADQLTQGSTRCYTTSKVCDVAGQLFMVLSPICGGIGVALNSQPFIIVATILSTGAVAIHRFGRYASNESISRMEAFKKLCRQEGVQPPGVTIGDGSSNGSNGE